MENPGEILQLCRLCLASDEVNVPIFGEPSDIRQISLKISSCLPVTIAADDLLPKNICEGCSDKLDIVYNFRHSSEEAEKKLQLWLEQISANNKESISAVVKEPPDDTDVKEETEDGHDDVTVRPSFDDDEDEDEKEELESEPPPPKRARRSAAVKAQINLSRESDEDEDDVDMVEPLTKVEDDSDVSDGDSGDAHSSFVDLPGTSADDQPGPSGVGKDGSDAPPANLSTQNDNTAADKIIDLSESNDQPKADIIEYTPEQIKARATIKIPCIKCNKVFSMDEFPSHQATHKLKPDPPSQEVKCTECGMDFDTVENLINHMKALHFSMWGTWRQYYNWNQTYGYPYSFDYASTASEASYGVNRRWADPLDRHGRARRSHSPAHHGRRGPPAHHHRGRHRHGKFHKYQHGGRSPERRRRYSSSSSSSSSSERYSEKSKSPERKREDSPIILLDSDEEDKDDGQKVNLANSDDEEWVVADSWSNDN